jgi:hypothetical protein
MDSIATATAGNRGSRTSDNFSNNDRRDDERFFLNNDKTTWFSNT